MDDRTAKLADALERRGQVGHSEIGQGGGITRTRSPLVNPEAEAVVINLPTGAGFGPPRREFGIEHPSPEASSTIRIVGGKLDQGGGH
jgi:hypothetical protein